MTLNSAIAADNKSQVRWFYYLMAAFILFAATAFVKDAWYVLLMPVAIVLITIAVFHLDWLVFFTVLITPLSINLQKTDIGIGVSLPAEPLMFALFIVFWMKIFAEGGLEEKIFTHPVSIAIYFYLAWMSLTTLSSTMFVVSFKSTLARYCYISVFYFMALHLFRRLNSIYLFLWLYISTLLIVIGYTILNHSDAGFTEKAAHTAMVPFYNDHTAYAAAISFFIPPMFAVLADRRRNNKSSFIVLSIIIILLLAIVLSYTRASWVGVLGALTVWFLFVFRIQKALILSGLVSLVILAFLFRTQISLNLAKNTKTSSTNLAEHVESISNVKSDASNIERLNRWSSAIRMFKDRPLLGFGPGTYMFQYGRYQKFSEKSIISTNLGTGGGSHSEYLGPLSEQGILGPVFFIAIGVTTILSASRVIRQSKSPKVRGLAKGLLIGLVTYWIQGALNYFLDTEKSAVPFWGFIAGIVALDIYHKQTQNEVQKS